MVQRIGASYVAKKFADYMMTPPARPADAETDAGPAAPAVPVNPVDELDGQVITDDDGQPLGAAHRVPGVAVYVVSQGRSHPATDLERCIDDPETRLFFHRVGDRIIGLIYVPDPSRAPLPVSGLRADDI